jgi:hypothetical protein
MTTSDKTQTPLQSAMTYTTIRLFKTKYPYPPIDYDPELDAAVRQLIRDRLNAAIFAADCAAFYNCPLPDTE